LVLAHSYQHSQLIGNLGNIALLRIAGEVGLIDQKIAHLVGSAYRLLRSRQHRLRLDGAEKTRIKLDNESELSDARSAVTSLWLEIFQAPSDAERSS
jgi:glutamate-ammonia-ligase adenylyltransferase